MGPLIQSSQADLRAKWCLPHQEHEEADPEKFSGLGKATRLGRASLGYLVPLHGVDVYFRLVGRRGHRPVPFWSKVRT